MARRKNTSSDSWMRQIFPDLTLFIAAIAVLAFASIVIIQKPSGFSTDAARTPSSSAFTSSPSAQKATTTAKAVPPVAVFIGDSYTTGVGGDGTKWTTLLAKSQGWREINIGNRGTGYAQTYAGSECPKSECPNYLQMISKAVSEKPDLVIVSGGRNDLASQPEAVVNIAKIFQQLREQLPKARIIAVSPFWGVSSYPSALADLGAKVRIAVSTASGTYLDVGPVLRNKANLATEGGSFPNAAGYKAIAAAVEGALKKS